VLELLRCARHDCRYHGADQRDEAMSFRGNVSWSSIGEADRANVQRLSGRKLYRNTRTRGPSHLGRVLRGEASLRDQHKGVVDFERFGGDESLSIANADRYAASTRNRDERIDEVIILCRWIVKL
jgi:hypothetical protein